MTLIKQFDALNATHPARAARLLFDFISDDDMRAQLITELNAPNAQPLAFESRALVDDNPGGKFQFNDDRAKSYRKTAYLVAHRDHVAKAYQDATDADPLTDPTWSHTPYQLLGGTFMLALNQLPSSTVQHAQFLSHAEQRDYCFKSLDAVAKWFDPIASVAFKAGASLMLKQRHFDLAQLAEMVAVHYALRLFGFGQADLPLLKETASVVGKGLMYVNVGRHFFADPAALPAAKIALAKLSDRAAELIDLYDQPVSKAQRDALADLKKEWDELRKYQFAPAGGQPPSQGQQLAGFEPIMQLMAKDTSKFSSTEKAIMVAGLISGTITNMRAAVCIAIKQFINLDPDALIKIRDEAREARVSSPDAQFKDVKFEAFRARVEEALRCNPPPPFVPRRAARDIELNGLTIPEGSELVISVGGGAWQEKGFNHAAQAQEYGAAAQCPFHKVFGGNPRTPSTQQPGRPKSLHSCIGMDLAMHSVTYTCRQLMCLPGLTQQLNREDGEVIGIEKKAGFLCERYPMEYDREKLFRQTALQTVLPIKSPVSEHAEALKKTLLYGAPFIEKVLREARHVHFASFMLLENDTKLVLFTAYDGDFDGYIGHFAREFGPLFDRFFSHIEGGPPAPIAKHPFEFVQFLKRYQVPSVGGLFFSAYPEARTDDIVHQFNRNREFDFLSMERGSK